MARTKLFYRERGGVTVVVGPWACRYTLPWRPGRFSNGSRWSSGWHRWREEPDW